MTKTSHEKNVINATDTHFNHLFSMSYFPKCQHEWINLIIYRLKEVIFKHYVLTSRHLIHFETLIFPWMKTQLISMIWLKFWSRTAFAKRNEYNFLSILLIYAIFEFTKLPFTQIFYWKNYIAYRVVSCHRNTIQLKKTQHYLNTANYEIPDSLNVER